MNHYEYKHPKICVEVVAKNKKEAMFISQWLADNRDKLDAKHKKA